MLETSQAILKPMFVGLKEVGGFERPISNAWLKKGCQHSEKPGFHVALLDFLFSERTRAQQTSLPALQWLSQQKLLQTQQWLKAHFAALSAELMATVTQQSEIWEELRV